MPPLKFIIEAALFAADKPLNLDHLVELFSESERPERSLIRAALRELTEDYSERGITLMQVASGYRFQTQENLNPWLKRLQPERSARYSRALLETLAIIAYRQPITRSEIEKIRGISVSTDLIKRLLDYNWIRILAHRDSPGRPALYGTTRAFLDYFNLKNLSDLPTLTELQEMTLPSLDSEYENSEQDAQMLESQDNQDNSKAADDETFESQDNQDNSKAGDEGMESKKNEGEAIAQASNIDDTRSDASTSQMINVAVERLENAAEENTRTDEDLETGEKKHSDVAQSTETPTEPIETNTKTIEASEPEDREINSEDSPLTQMNVIVEQVDSEQNAQINAARAESTETAHDNIPHANVLNSKNENESQTKDEKVDEQQMILFQAPKSK
jgi:segregation and condensation protein B